MIKMSEYAKRRQAIMQKVGRNGIIVLPAASEILRNGDAHYPYRQSSDFYYLTGFSEPDAVIVLAPKRKAGEYILFNRVRDREHEIWDGPRLGQEGAYKELLVDQAFPISELSRLLPELLAGRESLHYPLGMNKSFDKTILQAVNQLRSSIRAGLVTPVAFHDVTPTLHEMRLFKSKTEIALMQKAVDITGKAHVRAMEVCQPGMFEYELEAEILHTFYRDGARGVAYNTIVGAGKNSCVLHYIKNNQKITAHDLILIDAGCEYENYAADITRTFPANGKFSGEQRAIYDLVLESQLAALKTIKPGSSFMTAQTAIVKILTQGLIDLGILKGRLDDLIEKQAYFAFYMHRSGHWLGLDVHDVGRYRINNKWRTLEPGMTLTVEPGLYISADIKGVHKRWHNIGVRIEDNVLVTKKGNEVLSQAIPKKITDIEAIMAG